MTIKWYERNLNTMGKKVLFADEKESALIFVLGLLNENEKKCKITNGSMTNVCCLWKFEVFLFD